jgi:hypothetical protein
MGPASGAAHARPQQHTCVGGGAPAAARGGGGGGRRPAARGRAAAPPPPPDCCCAPTCRNSTRLICCRAGAPPPAMQASRTAELTRPGTPRTHLRHSRSLPPRLPRHDRHMRPCLGPGRASHVRGRHRARHGLPGRHPCQQRAWAPLQQARRSRAAPGLGEIGDGDGIALPTGGWTGGRGQGAITGCGSLRVHRDIAAASNPHQLAT